MSDSQKQDKVKLGEMHRIDADRNTGVSLEHRDAELYIALGLFLTALGLPVTFGTFFTMQGGDYRAAIVNLICGLVLDLIGIVWMGYGWISRKRLMK